MTQGTSIEPVLELSAQGGTGSRWQTFDNNRFSAGGAGGLVSIATEYVKTPDILYLSKNFQDLLKSPIFKGNTSGGPSGSSQITPQVDNSPPYFGGTGLLYSFDRVDFFTPVQDSTLHLGGTDKQGDWLMGSHSVVNKVKPTHLPFPRGNRTFWPVVYTAANHTLQNVYFSPERPLSLRTSTSGGVITNLYNAAFNGNDTSELIFPEGVKIEFNSQIKNFIKLEAFKHFEVRKSEIQTKQLYFSELDAHANIHTGSRVWVTEKIKGDANSELHLVYAEIHTGKSPTLLEAKRFRLIGGLITGNVDIKAKDLHMEMGARIIADGASPFEGNQEDGDLRGHDYNRHGGLNFYSGLETAINGFTSAGGSGFGNGGTTTCENRAVSGETHIPVNASYIFTANFADLIESYARSGGGSRIVGDEVFRGGPGGGVIRINVVSFTSPRNGTIPELHARGLPSPADPATLLGAGAGGSVFLSADNMLALSEGPGLRVDVSGGTATPPIDCSLVPSGGGGGAFLVDYSQALMQNLSKLLTNTSSGGGNTDAKAGICKLAAGEAADWEECTGQPF